MEEKKEGGDSQEDITNNEVKVSNIRNEETSEELPYYKKSLHVRQQEYAKARERIFKDWVPSSNEEPGATIKKCRSRYTERRKVRHAIETTTLNEDDDQRPFAKICIGGEKVFGLLDSGASISALGQGAEDLLKRNNIEWTRIVSKVKTADGNSQNIIGKTTIPIEYNGFIEKITFYIAPNLRQQMYLGIDFWRKFNIAPHIISEISVSERNDPNMHKLTA